MSWIIVIGLIYISALVYSAYYAKRINSDNADEILLARSGVPTLLLFLSFSATLFSTFTLIGVPDFFRNHGLATWVFIGVSDVAMGFIVLWFGSKYRRVLEAEGLRGVSSLLKSRYKSPIALFVYILGIFVFLAPYVTIQIKGISGIATALTPGDIPSWIWAFGMLFLILMYSWIGGLRAIMYSDVVQGLVLLMVIWVVATTLTSDFGGLTAVFDNVRNNTPALLEAPGPKGLMSAQFLIASFIAIMWMPITQPQLTTRVAAAKSPKEIPVMALGISVFAFIILLPTIAIGMIGAVAYPDLGASEFLAKVLVEQQTPLIGALAIVGLLAAAMSTADSQLFALGSESQLSTAKDETKLNRSFTRILVVLFAVGCFALSQITSSELVSLARVSFAGTALIGPMILLALYSTKPLTNFSPLITGLCLIFFLLGNLSLIPMSLLGVRLDLVLMALTTLVASSEYFIINQR